MNCNRRIKRTEPYEMALLRVEMVIRRLRIADLAKMIGWGRLSLSAQFFLGIPSPTARWKIERALDMPIWSSQDEFARRKAIVPLFPADPFLDMSLSQINRYAVDNKIPKWWVPKTKAERIMWIADHIEGQSRVNSTTQHTQ